MPPPHLVKQRASREFARRYGLTTLVETGTYQGAMVEAMRPHFKKIISIELSVDLAAQAQKRFAADPSVRILQGDSGKVIEEVLPTLKQPTLFWLDGHYSGGFTAKADLETPLTEEMLRIFNSGIKNYVLLVDDARLLGTGDYPSLEQIKSLAAQYATGWKVELADDILRIHAGKR